MNATAVVKHYYLLTPEERFRLILAASGRGDEAERGRLGRSGAAKALSMPDHAPWALAFRELAQRAYLELLEEAARYLDALAAEDDAPDASGLALAAGFVLRLKAEGWKRFCEGLSVPPWLLWQALPGFDRLERALALAESAALAPEDFVAWLNRVRPSDAPELAASPLTVDDVAAGHEHFLRQRAARWNG